MSRTRARPALTLLTVLALLLQLPFAVVLTVNGDTGAVAGGVRIGVAVASPVVFALFVRWPGRRVATLAALTLLDILVWAASADAGRATAPTGPGPGRWPGGPDGMWTQGFSSPEVTPFYAAFLFALVAAMAAGKQIWAIASAAGVWLGALLFGPLLGIEWSVGRVVSATIGLLIALSIGAFARRRRETRRLAAEDAAARHHEVIQAERLRIARDLHDVLGHSLSQINVQAGMGEHLIDNDPAQAKRALAAIKELSRTGLNEVRSVLHTMRSDTDTGSAAGQHLAEPLVPVPGLDDLPGLVAAMTGDPVIRLDDRRQVLSDGGWESPGSAADAAGFRIVQEALTNVVRHARAAEARVEISHEGAELRIGISDDGQGFGDEDTQLKGVGPGNGILGMRERATLLDGTFALTSAPGEGTHVSVRLPWSSDRPEPDAEGQR